MVSLVHYGETVYVVDSRISSFTTELAIFRYRIIILRKVSMFIHSKNSEIPSKEKKKCMRIFFCNNQQLQRPCVARCWWRSYGKSRLFLFNKNLKHPSLYCYYDSIVFDNLVSLLRTSQSENHFVWLFSIFKAFTFLKTVTFLLIAK